MKNFFAHLRSRPYLVISVACGLIAGWALPGGLGVVTRSLLGWNVGVWLFLGLVAGVMIRADHADLRRTAVAQAESASTVLALVIIAAVASLIAIIFELSAAKQAGTLHRVPHLMFALATVAGSWVLLPTLFSLSYASVFYASTPGGGLRFPEADPAFRPDYADFLYFSFTIAAAVQTADVAISTRPMRRLALLQSLLSFVFNTTILAFTINTLAGFF